MDCIYLVMDCTNYLFCIQVLDDAATGQGDGNDESGRVWISPQQAVSDINQNCKC